MSQPPVDSSDGILAQLFREQIQLLRALRALERKTVVKQIVRKKQRETMLNYVRKDQLLGNPQ